MPTTNHVTDRLDDYLDGTLPADERRTVTDHLAGCPTCQADLERRADLLGELQALPHTLEPSRDLWPGIRERLVEPAHTRTDRAADRGTVRRSPPLRRATPWGWAMAAIGAVAVGLALWRAPSGSPSGWNVVSLEGQPAVGQVGFGDRGTLREGDWLETDADSRARVDVGGIGQVEVAPDTRLQLRNAGEGDHRLALAEGEIEAFIWAPPRLFFVETPSAEAIDLGCIYTLKVDSTGSSLLHVTSGYVELEHDGRASLVPAGAMCMARPGRGPGTAFDEDASPALRDALAAYDFDHGGDEALNRVLAEARTSDAITLWQLLGRVEITRRAAVYDRLAELVAPPAETTREGMLNLDPEMAERWERLLRIHTPASKKRGP